MALRIIEPNEELKVETIILLAYGQPGIGKTTFGNTSSKPLLLDFDKGVARAGIRKTTIVVDKWEDVQELMKQKEVLEKYDTIVVDTVGRCLDMLSEYVIKGNYKLGTKNGNLTMQGWGELKMIFTTWLKQVRALGKDIIFIAHEKEVTEGDNTRKRPDMQGGSYAEVIKVADLIGYLSMVNNVATIDFYPCDAFYAKNGAKIEKQAIPDCKQYPEFAKNLISYAKEAMSKMSSVSNEIADKMIVWRDTINGFTTVEEFNVCYEDVKKITDEPLKAQVKVVFLEYTKKHGFEFSKEKGEWVKAAAQNLPPADTKTQAPVNPTPTPTQPKTQVEAVPVNSEEFAF